MVEGDLPRLWWRVCRAGVVGTAVVRVRTLLLLPVGDVRDDGGEVVVDEDEFGGFKEWRLREPFGEVEGEDRGDVGGVSSDAVVDVASLVPPPDVVL